MSVRRALMPVALALLAVGCSDERHPTAMQQPPAPAPHFLRWADALSPRFNAVGAVSTPGADGVLLASLSDGISLDRYTAAFWAVRDRERSVLINYVGSTGDTSFPFLQLTIDDPVYVPGRGDLAAGDSVLITVTIDPVNIKVSLEPTGLLFGDPARLRISYGGASGDLNGDGIVDGTDAEIETRLLGLWYREGAESAWTRISASQSISDKSFTSALLHFSEYAVSW